MTYEPNAEMPRGLLTLRDGSTLWGSCSHCGRTVDNHDEHHRVSAIGLGGRGVECVLRGDILPNLAQPLGQRAR